MTEYQTHTEFYVDMAIRAAQRGTGYGGAWRLWLMAKALDKKHGGTVFPNELKKFVLFLGVTPRTYQNWLKSAMDHGFLKAVTLRRTENAGRTKLYITAETKVAVIMQLERVVGKVRMEIKHLVGTGWKARVYSSVNADGRIKSREYIQKRYNVPVRTQRNRDKQAKTETSTNIAVSNRPATHLDSVAEFGCHAYTFSYHGLVAWRLPDTRTSIYCESVRVAKKFKSLEEHSKFLGCREVSSKVRFFCDTERQVRRSLKKIDDLCLKVSEIYKYAKKSKGVSVYEVITLPATLW